MMLNISMFNFSFLYLWGVYFGFHVITFIIIEIKVKQFFIGNLYKMVSLCGDKH